MRKLNFYTTGISLGLIPIIGLVLILFIFWLGLSFFAYRINVDGVGFLYIMFSIPIVIIGFILTITAVFKNGTNTKLKPLLGVFLIMLNLPTIIWILRTYNELSGRAYLKLINNSGVSLDNVTIKEPDNTKNFGALGQGGSKVIYFNPDYSSPDGLSYPGIGENYFLLTINQKTIGKKIPIIHPGETYKIVIDNKLNLSSLHTNKIVFNE